MAAARSVLGARWAPLREALDRAARANTAVASYGPARCDNPTEDGDAGAGVGGWLRAKRINDADLIVPGLWLGSLVAAFDDAWLTRAGITHILSLLEIDPFSNATSQTAGSKGDDVREDTPRWLREPHTAENAAEHSVGRNLVRLHKPVYDHHLENMRVHMLECVDWISDAIAAGGQVLVHCRAGISRSSTIVCAYIIHTHPALREHPSADRAIALVRARRHIVAPNRAFHSQLDEFAADPARIAVQRSVNNLSPALSHLMPHPRPRRIVAQFAAASTATAQPAAAQPAAAQPAAAQPATARQGKPTQRRSARSAQAAPAAPAAPESQASQAARTAVSAKLADVQATVTVLHHHPTDHRLVLPGTMSSVETSPKETIPAGAAGAAGAADVTNAAGVAGSSEPRSSGGSVGGSAGGSAGGVVDKAAVGGAAVEAVGGAAVAGGLASSGSVCFVTYCAADPWPTFFQAKTTYGAAVDLVFSKILANELTPPYGSNQDRCETHARFVDWIRSLSAHDRATLGEWRPVFARQQSMPVHTMFAQLCDAYKVGVEALAPTP